MSRFTETVTAHPYMGVGYLSPTGDLAAKHAHDICLCGWTGDEGDHAAHVESMLVEAGVVAVELPEAFVSSPDAPDLNACPRCNHATHLNEELCAFRDEHDGPVDYCGCPGPDIPALVAALRAAEAKLAAIQALAQLWTASDNVNDLHTRVTNRAYAGVLLDVLHREGEVDE